MLQPFTSELSSVFNSARCSASIRPLTVKITSPFVALVILSIFPLFSAATFGLPHFGYGQSQFQRKVIKTDGLAAGEMSGSSAIAEIPYSKFPRRFFCEWVGLRLAGFRGVSSLETVLVDLQRDDLRF